LLAARLGKAVSGPSPGFSCSPLHSPSFCFLKNKKRGGMERRGEEKRSRCGSKRSPAKGRSEAGAEQDPSRFLVFTRLLRRLKSKNSDP